MIECICLYDIVEENGKTIKENNLSKTHKYSIGTFVEVKHDRDDDEWNGVRLYITAHTRDCDGSPLYSLGHKGATENYEMFHGFGEENIEPVWISVKDRLPEPDTYVLTWGYWGTPHMDLFGTNGMFGGTIPYHNKITHWMPLPKGPEE